MTLHRLWLTLPLLTACALDEQQPDESTDTLEINGDQVAPASQFQLDRAVKINGCTATKISARFAITAAHCNPSVNSFVNFYTSGPGFAASERAQIVDVTFRPGVSGSACNNDIDDCWDSSGNFADIALLELAVPTSGAGTEANLEGLQATLAWEYPGDDAYGKKVGAGLHDGNSNNAGVLLQHPDYTSRDNDNDGRFYTVDVHTDGGDSGGPFYYSSKVLGTLWGKWWEPFDHYNIYTSVPKHLNWILTTIGYKWRGVAPQSNTLYSGTAVDSFYGTELECQYACEKTGSCEAYNFQSVPLPGAANCHLHTDVTEVATVSGWRGGLKHGARQSNANDVVGFVRADGVNAVMHRALNGNLHEMRLVGGNWQVTDINPSATVSSRLSSYRRVENVDAIIFRSSTNRVIQLLRTSTGWNDEADLTTLTGAELAAGNPTAYVRADGINAVVYRGATTGHIIELRRGSRGFIATDLTAAAGSSLVASSDPIANVRSDGFNSIVFRTSGGNLAELFKTTGGGWSIGNPAANAGAPAPADRPFAYTKRDGTNTIVYRQATNQIVELTLVGSQWQFQNIASNASSTAQPVGYVRADGASPMLYRNASSQIVQVTAATTNLTTLTGAPVSATNPMAWVRTDGFNSVLFEDSANHVREFFVKLGGNWADGDISANAGETP
jgi:hypothetical protein